MAYLQYPTLTWSIFRAILPVIFLVTSETMDANRNMIYKYNALPFWLAIKIHLAYLCKHACSTSLIDAYI